VNPVGVIWLAFEELSREFVIRYYVEEFVRICIRENQIEGHLAMTPLIRRRPFLLAFLQITNKVRSKTDYTTRDTGARPTELEIA
jgi:hypothetical protein